MNKENSRYVPAVSLFSAVLIGGSYFMAVFNITPQPTNPLSVLPALFMGIGIGLFLSGLAAEIHYSGEIYE